MKKLLVFNWKMNPASYEEAERILFATFELANNAKETEIVVCPPFTWLTDFSHKAHQGVKFGAQDVFWKPDTGAFTGEVSDTMLKNSGVEYVIIGHSERRKLLGETDEMIQKKVKSALTEGLKVILCVGEEASVRDQGLEAVKSFIKNQLAQDLKGIENLKLEIENLIVAYEPIWAIGTGTPCSPKDALQIISFIKELLATSYQLLATRVLYGGSVTGKDILDFIQLEDIDGALVGGASLKPEQFLNVIH